jgi:hypothetical protein
MLESLAGTYIRQEPMAMQDFLAKIAELQSLFGRDGGDAGP